MATLRRNGHIRTHIHVNGPTDQPVLLELDKQRWRCGNCKSTLTATTSVVKPKYSISNGLVEYALKLAMKSTTSKSIASITGISTTTVGRILNDNINPRPLNYLPTVLVQSLLRESASCIMN